MRSFRIRSVSPISHASAGCITPCIFAQLIPWTNSSFWSFLQKVPTIFKAQDKFRIDILLSNLPEILALSVNQTKAVKRIRFFREETNILIEKLPILRDITFSATKGFISVIKVYFISQVHVLKPLEFLYRKWIALFQKVTFRPW